MYRYIFLLTAIAALTVLAFINIPGKIENTGSAFFMAIKINDRDGAHIHLSDEFKKSIQDRELSAYINENYLGEIDEINWSKSTVNGDMAELLGIVKTVNSSYLPVKLTFVRDPVNWKIYSFQKPSAGFVERASFGSVPGEDMQVRLVSEAMHVFATAVKQRSMDTFHQFVAYLWQKQVSLDEFNNAYKSFITASPDLTGLDQLTPAFSGPATINKQGVLHIKGFYSTTPKQVKFEQKYIFEGLNWKLIGFKIDI